VTTTAAPTTSAPTDNRVMLAGGFYVVDMGESSPQWYLFDSGGEKVVDMWFDEVEKRQWGSSNSYFAIRGDYYYDFTITGWSLTFHRVAINSRLYPGEGDVFLPFAIGHEFCINDEHLYLAEQAISFLVALNRDFDSTFRQIRHGESRYIPDSRHENAAWLSGRFNSHVTLLSIEQVNVLGMLDYDEYSIENSCFLVTLHSRFSDEDRLCWVGVEFTKAGNRWVVNNVYGYVG
jgi:hypothetical protein